MCVVRFIGLYFFDSIYLLLGPALWGQCVSARFGLSGTPNGIKLHLLHIHTVHGVMVGQVGKEKRLE